MSYSLWFLYQLSSCVDLYSEYFPQCGACTAGNLAQIPLPSHSDAVPTIPGAVVEVVIKDLIHGPDFTVTPTFSGRKYVFQAVNVASDYGHRYLLRSCQNLHHMLRKLIATYNTDHHPIRIIRVDSYGF